MYSAYELNKQGDNIQAWHTPFPIWNESVAPCPVLTEPEMYLNRDKLKIQQKNVPLTKYLGHLLYTCLRAMIETTLNSFKEKNHNGSENGMITPYL